MEDKIPEPCKFQLGEWIWICRCGPNKLIRDYVEIDEVNSEGKITHLADGRRINFLKCFANSLHDVYTLYGDSSKMLIQRTYETAIKSIEKQPSETSEFSWE